MIEINDIQYRHIQVAGNVDWGRSVQRTSVFITQLSYNARSPETLTLVVWQKLRKLLFPNCHTVLHFMFYLKQAHQILFHFRASLIFSYGSRCFRPLYITPEQFMRESLCTNLTVVGGICYKSRGLLAVKGFEVNCGDVGVLFIIYKMYVNDLELDFYEFLSGKVSTSFCFV